MQRTRKGSLCSLALVTLWHPHTSTAECLLQSVIQARSRTASMGTMPADLTSMLLPLPLQIENQLEIWNAIASRGPNAAAEVSAHSHGMHL